jgi:hypothetical protein
MQTPLQALVQQKETQPQPLRQTAEAVVRVPSF